MIPPPAAEAGPWRTSRVPYMREPMDRFSPSDPCRRVTFVKCSQVGGSESANNVIGFYIDQAPTAIMLIQPREKDAINYSKERIAPMIDATPALRGKVADAKSKTSGNTLQDKRFAGGMMRICGANAPANLRSLAARVVVADEVDGFPLSAGTEGDPLKLAEKRQTTFRAPKTFEISTPTDEDSRIVKSFELTDQRRYVIACPACKARQVLEFDRLQYEVTDRGRVVSDSVHYVCQANGCVVHEREKVRFLPEKSSENPDGAQWLPSWIDDDTGSLAFGENAETADHYGYHINAMYSPLGWCSWAMLAQEFVEASGDPLLMRVFVNTRLGLVYRKADGETVDAGGLEGRTETYSVACPDGVAVITAGLDVQKDRIECEVVGWGLGFESWSLDYRVFPGDTEIDAVWSAVKAWLRRASYATSNGGALKVSAACWDTGYNATLVYKHIGPHFHRMWWGVKGKSGDREIWPQAWSRGGDRQRTKFKLIGVDKCKDHVYARLEVDTVGPSFCHFPEGRESWWFRQLTAERKELVIRNGKRSRRYVIDDGVRNEALDCRVYAYAALHGWLSAGYSLEVAATTRDARAARQAQPARPKRKRREGTLTRRKLRG